MTRHPGYSDLYMLHPVCVIAHFMKWANLIACPVCEIAHFMKWANCIAQFVK